MQPSVGGGAGSSRSMPSVGLGPALLGASGHCGRPRVSGNHALLPGRPTGLSVAPTNGLAEGIAQSGKYDLTISAVAVDERNSGLEACLRKNGIAELRQGGDLHGACRGGRDNRRRRCVRVRRAGAGPDRQFGQRYRLRICAWTPTTRFAAVRRKSDWRWALRFDGSYLDFGSETYRVNLSGNNSCGPGGAMTACRYTVRNRLGVVRLGIVYGFGE